MFVKFTDVTNVFCHLFLLYLGRTVADDARLHLHMFGGLGFTMFSLFPLFYCASTASGRR